MTNVMHRARCALPRAAACLLTISLCIAPPVAAQASASAGTTPPRYVRAEYRIPMRDGTKLFTVVYTPQDTTVRVPILLNRTRYGVGRYGPEGYTTLRTADELRRDPYIFVVQDVRGSFMSEGQFVDMTPQLVGKAGPTDVDQSTDSYDTIDWLVKHVAHNNGKVGIWGVSYDGFYAAAGLINAHPALAAGSPQAPQADWFNGDDLHFHGTFVLDGIAYLSTWGRTRPGAPTTPSRSRVGTNDGYRFYLDGGSAGSISARFVHDSSPMLNEVMRHGTYDDFWKARNILPHLTDIRPAVMTVSGWYDANNLYGALHVHAAIAKSTPRATNMLVLGPWQHGGWNRGDGSSLGDVEFGSATAQFFRDSIRTPFFAAHLKDAPTHLPNVYAFETGTNAWRTFDAWPPRQATARTLYLKDKGVLSFDPPPSSRTFAEFRNDPSRPVPFIQRVAPDRTTDYMIQDQRFAARRPDVLVYHSEPLTEDITIAGPVRPSLWVSTTGTDADWVVKLIDEYPDDAPEKAAKTGSGPLRSGESMAGYQQLVRGDVMRGKFRNSMEKPEAMVPDAPTHVAFEMMDVLHTFRKGHRIMVQVQGTWFPLVDRNPGQFLDVYHATLADYHPTTQRVHHSAAEPSGIEVYVIRP